MKIEHEILIDGLREIEDESFQEWERITECSGRDIASLLRRIYEELV